ncbi:MAG: uncharacterized membrane protein YhaH (DUF805 family) [Paracoccaceae bacterium]|jgi:uncharacterized membrane protein YhaH (DUF805 family)
MTTANPYQAPASDVTQAQSNRPYQPKIFTADGRIGRLRYLAYSMIINLCFIPVALLVLAIGAATTGDSGQPSVIVWILGGIAYIALIATSFVLAKRRLNDLNQSGWLSLLLLVPLVNLGIILWLIFAPGKKEQNSYGPYPVKNPGGIVALALIIPFIAIVGIIAAITIPAYVDYAERAASSSQGSASEFE